MPLDEQVELFVSHLVTVEMVSPRTADQYVSHVVRRWIEERSIVSSEVVRTRYLAIIIEGFEKKKRKGHPMRDSAKIPLTYPLLIEAVKAINLKYGVSSDDAISLRAAFAIGYGCSLRPGEYLLLPANDKDTDEQICADHINFWWDEDHYNATQPQKFPRKRCDKLSMAIDFIKNDQLGKGLPRALAKAPIGETFCCLTAIEDFARSRKLIPNQPFLMTNTGQVKWLQVREILRIVARANGLDEDRLVPQGIRGGVVNQLDAHGHSNETKERQGGWTSSTGMQAYLRSNFRHAEKVVTAMHDANAIPIAHTKLMFAASGTVGNAARGSPASSLLG